VPEPKRYVHESMRDFSYEKSFTNNVQLSLSLFVSVINFSQRVKLKIALEGTVYNTAQKVAEGLNQDW
jgi:hypothetical protein